METKVKCPVCGEMLKVVLENEEQTTVEVKRNCPTTQTLDALAEIIRKGQAPYWLSVGDEIVIPLKNGEKVTMQIAAFNPYGENTVALVAADAIKRLGLNKECTYKGGWKDCELRKALNEEFYKELPADFKAMIKERTIKQRIGDKIVEYTDKIWLPSKTEVCGETADEVDDVHFALFANEKSRVKMADGETWFWWLRSAHNSTRAWYVSASGALYDGRSANDSGGVVPACIIG